MNRTKQTSGFLRDDLQRGKKTTVVFQTCQNGTWKEGLGLVIAEKLNNFFFMQAWHRATHREYCASMLFVGSQHRPCLNPMPAAEALQK